METIPSAPLATQEATTNDESRTQSMDTIINNSTEKDIEQQQQQQQVPSSSTESTDQCSDERNEETSNCESPKSGTNDSTVPLTLAANTTSESVPTNTNELNNDDANDLASSSRLMEIESDCRTETKLNNKLDKSEIINELTTASIANNCDSSEILDDSMNVIHSNGSNNNVSDSRGDNVDMIIENELSSNVNAKENGAKNFVDEMTTKTDDETNLKLENYPTLSPTPSSTVACAIEDSSSLVDSTETHLNENKVHEEPSSSVESETEKIHSQSDNTPSVHSNISDKGGGTDDKNSTFPSQSEEQSPANKIVLNNSVDSVNSSVDTNVHKIDQKVEINDPKLEDESSRMDICSTSRTEDKIGCDPKHSSVVENQVAYCGSVIRPTNLIVSNIKENTESKRDEIESSSQYNAERIVRSDSLPHIELPKSSMEVNNKTTELKQNSSYVKVANNSLNDNVSPHNLSLDLTQSHSLSNRQNSLYVSNPDFSRPKPSTEDLSSLRMKPPDFTKLTHAYSTNNLKIPNPNFNEIDAPLKHYQPPINPANFAEISKRLNYISDLQLKTTTTPPTNTNSFDRTLDSSRSMSNLYVKAPDFSGQKKKSYDAVDEPTAHVIHKNPYPIQSDKPNKIVAPPSDPSIIYRNYPQISQDVTMSIVPTQNAPFPQQSQQLSQKQNMVEPQQSVDQRFKQNYPAEVHKGMYRSPVPTTHHTYENRMSDPSNSSHAKPLNISYKHKADQVSSVQHSYQRESTRAAVIQSGKSNSVVSEREAYGQKVQSSYVQRNEMQYYEKPVAKPVVVTNPHGPPMDYMHSQQHLNNSRYPSEYNDRTPSSKSNFERPGYSEPMPSMYQEHYKQPPSSSSMKHKSSNNTQMAAPSNRPVQSPIMNSKPIDIPSSGHMNPPQYWPSHSPRISQSPISLSSSPLSGRVTQSPAGASPSPQHHIMHTPSALPAQSPTYRYTSPHQSQTPSPYNIPTTTSSPVPFKDTVNPAMYQKSSKTKTSKSAKANVSQPPNSNYYYLPPETNHFPGHQYSMKVEQHSAHYPPHQYSAKTENNVREDTRTKQNKNKLYPDYVDLTKSSKPSDIPSPHMPNSVGPESRYDHRYSNERHEMHQGHRPETVPNKHAPESLNRATDKHVYNSQQKTIMDPYAYRKASEADLNYEIIKKTLNKDISIRRSDADLSCSIFDTPKSSQSKNVGYPTSNEQYYGQGSSYPPNFNYHPQPPEAPVQRDSKGVPIMDGNRFYAVQPATKGHEAEQSSRSKAYSTDNNSARPPNDLKKHDLSVTVSRISAAIAQPVVERARLQHSETTIPIPHQPSTSRLQSTTQAAKAHLPQAQPAVPQKPSSTVKSVLTPVKRESPLDLSVKTVKTKADSTGDDYAVPSSSRDYNAPLSLKVDFSPNFQKHARVPDKSTSNHIQPRYDNQLANSQYQPPVHRPTTQPVNHNVPQRSSEKSVDARYQHPHQSHHAPSTYAQSQVPMTPASTQIRSNQIPNDSFRHQSKPLVLSPAVPTVFGRKPEELKNLPINPEIHDYKSSTSNAMGSFENDHRTKNQTIKSNYHNKHPEHLLNSHHKPQEIPVKFSDFKTKNNQNPPMPSMLVESSKERPPYGYSTGERPTYMVNQYQEQRPTHIPSQPRLVEQMPPGHYDPFFASRKRAADPPTHDQYPKVKQMRRDEPPNQHAQYYNMDKRYPAANPPPLVEPKIHERYEMPVGKMDYHPKFMGSNYEREMVEQKYSSVDRMPPVNVESRESINPAAVVRENIPPNYGKQHPYHYPEPLYNQMENKGPPAQSPIMSYPSEQHQKHLAYQKSKKEAYKQLPSPPSQQNYYPRDGKQHVYENYISETYQPYKTDAKPYYNNEPGYVPNTNPQYPKQDTNPPLQVYQQQWPQNQPTLQPDSSKQPYYPAPEVRRYKEFNQSTHPPQPSTDIAARPNHRYNPIDASSSRNQTTLKGADQTVISKLRTNLEMKEIEKQKMLRNQSSTETVEDDNQKSDIASLIAARIRTKGELKGFTPIPADPEPKSDPSNRCDDENKIDLQAVGTIPDIGSDGDNASAFDLLDWGSACNDFVEQLQGAGTKKRGRRRRGRSSLIDTEFETVEQEVPLENLPGIEYKCDIDENVVNIVKAENKSHQDDSVNNSAKKDEDSSSDEDKPLLFLRQKSLNELGKLKAAQDDDAVNESSTFSESTKQSSDKRTNVLAKLSEKLSKNKKGQQREKRENEKRISIASSSESDDEISSKANKRHKKTVRKPRTRSSVGYKNTSDDETSENGSKNSKRKNDHTKRKKSGKSSSDSEPLKQRKKNPKVDSDDKTDSGEESDDVKLVTIKQEVISDDDDSDCKIEMLKTPVKKEPGAVSVKMEETMTRSKRKQELERQKANSKVLRNEKMVKNVSVCERKSCDPKKGNEKNSPKSKCKSKDDGKRKSDDTETGESSKNDSPKKKGFRVASVQSISSDSEETEVEVSLRRRTRSAKSMDQRTPEKSKNAVEKVSEKKWSRNTPQKKATKEPISKPSIEQYPPGWENDVYAFKRSLKIPASLITIKRPSWYRKSISLPDLDPHSSDTSDTFSEKKQLFLKPFSELSDRKPSKKDSKNSRPVNATTTNEQNVPVPEKVPEKRPDDLRSKSIIDLLHQKIIHPVNRNSKKSRLLSNEPKLLPQSNEIELLPTPGAENVFKHQSVFETNVLKSRTRKEYRVQKNQEIIREVFGCDDRPASAPPLHANVDNKVPAITFDQKYKQYLEKMNMDFGDSKLAKCEIKPDVSIVKQEKLDDDSLLNDETQDTEINECERNALDIKDEPIDSNERDTPSVSEREGITPSSFSLIRKRGRGARGSRRKGSSGM